jgi:hypothetical protein
MAKYTLELDSEQAHALVKALDFYSLMGMHQFEEIASFMRWNGQWDLREVNTGVKLRAVERACDELKRAAGHEPNSCYGITCPEVPKVCKVCYDLECVLRQQVARIEKYHKMSTWHHDPMHIVSDVPLAKCTVEE